MKEETKSENFQENVSLSIDTEKCSHDNIYVIDSPTDSPRKKNSINDFDIIQALGRGSYAKVVLARNIFSGMQYAIKIIDKKFLEKVISFNVGR